MEIGEIIGFVAAAVFFGAPPAIVFIGLPAYWGWKLARHLTGH